MMKKTISVITLIGLIQPSVLLAQNTGINTPVVTPIVGVGNGGGNTLIGAPGAYESINANITATAIEAMKMAAVTNELDRQYVLSAVSEMQTRFVELSDAVING